MSDTPRTDAEALKWGPHEGVPNVVIPTHFARDLERDLQAEHLEHLTILGQVETLERDCGILALAAEEVYEIVKRIPESHRSSTETAVIDRIRAAIIQANTKTALPVTSSSSSENT